MKNKFFLAVLFLSLLFVNNFVNSASYVIQNATIHTADDGKVIENGLIVFDDESIIYVGNNISSNIPADAKIIDGSGKVVTPGLVAANTTLGLVEVASVESTVDSSVSDYKLGPGFDISPAINPWSMLIPIQRHDGITAAMVMPTNGNDIFAGLASLINLGGTTNYLEKKSVAMMAAYDASGKRFVGNSKAAIHQQMEEAFAEARRYQKNPDSYRQVNTKDYHYKQVDLDALLLVLTRKVPLVVKADRAIDIRQLLAFAKKENIRLAVAGGCEAWKIADEIAVQTVPVIIDTTDNRPSSFDRLSCRLDNAALLDKAGVELIFYLPEGTGSPHNIRNLPQKAGIAVSYGLPYQSALAAITKNPAKLYGGENMGVLSQGKLANLVLWTGDPFELKHYAEKVFIRGQLVGGSDRQQKLRDRYKNIREKDFAYQ